MILCFDFVDAKANILNKSNVSFSFEISGEIIPNNGELTVDDEGDKNQKHIQNPGKYLRRGFFQKQLKTTSC